MKQTIMLGLLLLPMLTAVIMVPTVYSSTVRGSDHVTITADEIIDRTLFAGANDIDIDGTVNGDVICGAESITISGNVGGDVICGAQTIEIRGRVDGDVRLAAQTITIEGAITGNASLAAQTITIGTNGIIKRDAQLGAETLHLDGAIGRDLDATASRMLVSGTIGRDVAAEVDKLELQGNARIAGSVDYRAPQELNREPGAVVDGKISWTERKEKEANHNKHGLGAMSAAFMMWSAAGLLIWTLFAVLIWPHRINRAANDVLNGQNWVKTMLAGLVATVVFPVVTVIAFSTGVGYIVGIFSILLWLAMLLPSVALTAYLLGRLIFRLRSGTKINAILVMLVGAMVMLVLMAIPIINGLVIVATGWFGFGMLIRSAWSGMPSYTFATKQKMTSRK